MNKTLIFASAIGAVMMATTACIATGQGQNDSTNPAPLQSTEIVSNTLPAATTSSGQAQPTVIPPTQAPVQPSPTVAAGPSQSSSLAQQLDTTLTQLGGSLESQDTLNDAPASP